MTKIRTRLHPAAAAGLAALLAAALVAAACSRRTFPPLPWLNGWARTVSGDSIGYHSPYPEAASALIVRATDGKTTIAWETDRVPPAAGDSAATVTFAWLSGLATGKGAHVFSLSSGGRPLVAFRTGRTERDRDWTVRGESGARLSFRTTLVDQFKELFGFMFLELPRGLVEAGRPVRLEVSAESAGSRDWFMVFQYVLAPWVRVGPEQALVRRPDGRASQLVRVEISRIGPPGRASLSIPGAKAVGIRVEPGYNFVQIPVAAVSAPTPLSVAAEIEGEPPSRHDLTLEPVPKRELWLLPHSHVDIGYSDPQAAVEKKQWRNLEESIALARRTAGYPAGARFKWNSEVLWAVETYLRQAPEAKRRELVEAVRRGWIGLQALLANELTGLCQPEELFHLTEFARRLSTGHGLEIDAAMITDIPSYTWAVVPALVQSRVRYLSSGPNYITGLPDGGDRIGGALRAWGDRPFYWVSPSGKERLLFWMAGRGYSWFHGLNLGNLAAGKGKPILDYCRDLAAAGYPYDMVQVRYTVGGDNGPPDPDLPDVVRSWNERYESPRFVIATAGEMFRELERRHGSKIPEVRGDFTPYWEDGAASTARETALNRAAGSRLLQAEALRAMSGAAPFPAEDFYEAWRQVLLFDEHTWGAADSVSDPDGPNAKGQWAYKQAFALGADRRSRDLLDEALRPAAAGAGTVAGPLAVLNTNGWERSGVALVPAASSGAGDRVLDERGAAVPSQRLSTGELAFLASRVPSLSAARFRIGEGRTVSPPPSGARAAGTRLENERIALDVDPVRGTIRSLRLKSAPGVELVDAADGRGLDAYLYVPGRDPAAAVSSGPASVSVREAGPLVASLLVVSSAPGAKGLTREYRLAAGSDRLEIVDRVDKALVRDKESVHIAFPFRVPGGVVRVDLGWGFVRPESDQIAGACRDFFCPQNSIDVSNGERGLTWVTPDAPLAEIGRLTDERIGQGGVRRWPATGSPSPLLFGYVMNNYWHTNYKADQEGPVELRFAIRPHGPFAAEEAVRLGLEEARPLLVAPDPGFPAGPLLEVRPAAAVLTSIRPSADGRGVVARLYNPTDRPVDVSLGGRAAGGASLFLSDPFESRRGPLPVPLRLAPLETAAVRLDKDAPRD